MAIDVASPALKVNTFIVEGLINEGAIKIYGDILYQSLSELESHQNSSIPLYLDERKDRSDS
jgi:hypothetical protein